MSLSFKRLDETAVDLQHVKGHPLEIGERRVLGAEVIDSERDAESPKADQRVDRGLGVLQDLRLRQLQAERGGGKTVGCEHAARALHQEAVE